MDPGKMASALRGLLLLCMSSLVLGRYLRRLSVLPPMEPQAMETPATGPELHGVTGLHHSMLAGVKARYQDVEKEILGEWGHEYLHTLFTGQMSFSDNGKTIIAKMQRAIILQRPFIIGFTGTSMTAGHDNLFNQAYPSIVQRQIGHVFEPTGATFEGRNGAMGNNPPAPYEYCLSRFAGRDPDVIIWEMNLMVLHDPCPSRDVETFLRTALALPSQPAVLVLANLFGDAYSPNCTFRSEKDVIMQSFLSGKCESTKAYVVDPYEILRTGALYPEQRSGGTPHGGNPVAAAAAAAAAAAMEEAAVAAMAAMATATTEGGATAMLETATTSAAATLEGPTAAAETAGEAPAVSAPAGPDLFATYYKFGIHSLNPQFEAQRKTCHDERYTYEALLGSWDKAGPSKASWHPNAHGHRLMGGVLSLHYLQLLLHAVEALNAAFPGITASDLASDPARQDAALTALQLPGRRGGDGGSGGSGTTATTDASPLALPPPLVCGGYFLCREAGNYRCATAFEPRYDGDHSDLLALVHDTALTPADPHNVAPPPGTDGQWAVILNEGRPVLFPDDGQPYPIDHKWALAGTRKSGPLQLRFEVGATSPGGAVGVCRAHIMERAHFEDPAAVRFSLDGVAVKSVKNFDNPTEVRWPAAGNQCVWLDAHVGPGAHILRVEALKDSPAPLVVVAWLFYPV